MLKRLLLCLCRRTSQAIERRTWQETAGESSCCYERPTETMGNLRAQRQMLSLMRQHKHL